MNNNSSPSQKAQGTSASDYYKEIRQAAESWQSKGYEIVPTAYVRSDGSCSCSEGPNCSHPGKHPAARHWTTTYTSKDKKVSHIIRAGQGFGIRTGSVNELLVIDCESLEAANAIVKKFKLKKTLVIKTGRGYHFYLTIPEGIKLKGVTKVFEDEIPGVDIRAENNFVMAPPSKHPSGERYKVAEDRPIVPAPEELLEEIQKKANDRREVAWQTRSVFSGSSIPVGMRHETFKAMAVKYRSLCLSKEETLDLLTSLPYENPADDPFSSEQITDLVEWAFETIEISEVKSRLVRVLLEVYDTWSRSRPVGKAGGTDRSAMLAIVQQGLVHGVEREGGIDVPIAQRTLRLMAGIGSDSTAVEVPRRLREKGALARGEAIPGSSCSVRRVPLPQTPKANALPIPKGKDTEPNQVKSVYGEDTYPHPSLPDSVEGESLYLGLLEMIYCMWVKDGFGKVNAAHLTALLYHSTENNQKVYKTGEMAKAISEIYGQEVKSNSLYRFREKCRRAGILKNVARGHWEILDDVYDRLREYQGKVGEDVRYKAMRLGIDEDRRQYRLEQKLEKAGLYHAFKFLELNYLGLCESGDYNGECPNEMRALLKRALADGEYVGPDADHHWPDSASGAFSIGALMEKVLNIPSPYKPLPSASTRTTSHVSDEDQRSKESSSNEGPSSGEWDVVA